MLLAMVRRVSFIACVGLLVACGPSASSSGSVAVTDRAAGAVCGPHFARTLAGDAVARVYVSAGKAYGCAAGSARSYKLGTTGNCIAARRIESVRVAGRLAAYGLETCGVDTGQTTVNVRRLTTGKSLAQRAATTRVGVEGFQSVVSLVVKANGAVAWIGDANSLGKPKFVRQLQRLDARGFRLLDSGRPVAPASLTLHRSTLSWRHGTAVRTATLR
ncbi:MAG TPA: hypothetical protein VGL51_01260 [Solirubrobacteraceae bacterium]|jgi:hypothetical protein